MTASSESLFEQFCAANALSCSRVPTADASGEQRPDYYVTGPGSRPFFAEIKEITPNPAEADQIRRVLAGEILAMSGTPGARARELIAKANPQLRAVTKGVVPGVLVIFNTEFLLHHHTDPYAILTAMRGLDVVPVLVPTDARKSPIFQDVRSGPKKRMTPQANTSISAIVLPCRTRDAQWQADVYHNRYAACALPPESLLGDSIRHWGIREDERDWERLHAAV